MTDGRLSRAESVFHEVADLPAAERRAALARLCAGDDALLARVSALLEADAATRGDFLQTPALERAGGGARGLAALPESIAGFRIVRLLGEGGMGAVYEAEQARPHRLVALKVIRGAFVSPPVLARFDREAQALALLSHPGIAAIHEAGTFDVPGGGGRQPYLVMELVRGLPIDVHAHRLGLGVRERLALVARVCDAVQHAHARGVIHRDLKPANILVENSESGGEAQPKILDFGVARLTDPGAAPGPTLRTDAGQIIGTLAYMSPEQVAGDAGSIDARTDVYALGVILFELLTGRPPIDVRGMSIPEAARAIHEQEATHIRSLAPGLPTDATTIARRALEKDPARRYAAPSELAADIRRFLRDEPIHARPPSRAYRASKFVRRHRAGVVATSLVLLALGAGLAFSTASAIRARRAEAAATASRDVAQTKAAQAAAVTKFLGDMLSAVRPSRARGKDVTVAQALDEAAARLDRGELAKQPEVEASVRLAMGTTHRTLSNYAGAEEQTAKALEIRRTVLGESHRETVDALAEWAHLRDEQGKYEEAIGLNEKVLAARRADEGPRSPEAAGALLRLGSALQRGGKLDEAEAAYRESLEIRRELTPQGSPDLAASLDAMARILNAKGKYAESEPLLREALEMRRTLLGPEHPEVARSLSSLASLIHDRGRLAEAEPLYREAVDIDRKVYPKGDMSLAISLNNLASLLQDKRDFDGAQALFEESLAMRRAIVGNEHPSVGTALNNLGVLANLRGDSAAAAEWFRQAIAVRTAALGENHIETVRARLSLAAALLKSLPPAQAVAQIEDCCAALAKAVGEEHPSTLTARNTLVDALALAGRADDAQALARKVLEQRERILGADHPDALISVRALALVLADAGKGEEALALAARQVAAWEARKGATPAQKQAAANSAALIAEKSGRADLAQQWRAKATALASP